MKLRTTLALIGALAVTVPVSASAHVTLQPEEGAAGDYTVLDVRVPNERDDAATTKVEVRFPSGFSFASYQPVPGWSGKVLGEVSKITWTADSAQAGIQPQQFQDFPISVQIPDKPGAALTFKVLQTYDDGEVARWTGAPDSAEPAPQVKVTAGEGGHGTGADEEASGGDPDSASKGLGIAALVVAALALLAGSAALMRSRRTA